MVVVARTGSKAWRHHRPIRVALCTDRTVALGVEPGRTHDRPVVNRPNDGIPSNVCDATSNEEDHKMSGLQSYSIQQRNCLSQTQTSWKTCPISQHKITSDYRCVSSDSTSLVASERVETQESEHADTQPRVKENPTLKIEKYEQNNTIIENDPSLINCIASNEKDDFFVDTLCATNDLVVPNVNTVEYLMTDDTPIHKQSYDNCDVAPNILSPTPSYEDLVTKEKTKKKKRRPNYDPPLKIYVVPNDNDVLLGRGGKLMKRLLVSFTLHKEY